MDRSTRLDLAACLRDTTRSAEPDPPTRKRTRDPASLTDSITALRSQLRENSDAGKSPRDPAGSTASLIEHLETRASDENLFIESRGPVMTEDR